MRDNVLVTHLNVIDWKVKETFEYYDFTRLFTATTPDEKLFLVINVIDNRLCAAYLAAEIDEDLLSEMKENKKDLKYFIENSTPLYYIVDGGTSGILVYDIPIENVNKEWIPEAGVMLCYED